MHNVLTLIGNCSKTGVLFLVIALLGCQNIEYPKKPKDLIPEDKMVEVLTDVHLFHAAKGYNRIPLQQTGNTPHQFIYEKHGIDSVQYEKSNLYYGANLKKYSKIHEKVKAYLEIKKSELDTLIKIERKKQDSIKFVNDSVF